MVYALLPNKQQTTYNRMFLMVKISCTKSWSGSHPLLSSLWFRAGPHQCSLIELSNCWTQGLLLPLLPSNLAKGPCFSAARGVQIWEWNPKKLCAEDSSHLLCSPQFCLSSMARCSTRSPRGGQNWWLCHILWQNLDQWPFQTPAVELLQLQWAKNEQSCWRLALPVEANRWQTASKYIWDCWCHEAVA